MFTNILKAVAFSAVKDSQLLVTIDFGQLEQVFTGLFQAAFIIGVLGLIIGIFLIFFPGLKTFLGKIVGI